MIFFIFALFFGITCSLPGMSNEKGIRCNTGAVPAAVSPLKVSDSNATVLIVSEREGSDDRTSQKTCRNSLQFFCFREI